MLRTKPVVAASGLLLSTLALLTTAPLAAQTQQTATHRSSSPRLLDRLDAFGRNLFGGLKTEKESPQPTQAARNPGSSGRAGTGAVYGGTTARAGSVLEPGNRAGTPTIGRSVPVVIPRTSTPPQTTGTITDGGYEPSPGDSSGAMPQAADSADPTASRMYERLSVFRKSAFGSENAPKENGLIEPGALEEQPLGMDEMPAEPPEEPTTARRPSPAPGTALSGRAAPDRVVAERPMPERVLPDRPAAPAGEMPGADSGLSAAGSATAVDSIPAAVRSPVSSTTTGNVLISRKGPVIDVQTIGPRRILVGQESAYEIAVRNSGEAADEVVVHVELPTWAEVLGAEVSTGATQVGEASATAVPFQWRIGRLSAGTDERLVLRIVPRASRPFELAVRWDFRPLGSQAAIEVQEPKLELQLEGPQEVLYEKKEVFTLTLANTGNGDAANAVITLLPVGTGDNRPASHKFGTVPAGQKRSIEVELTARQTGTLMIQVEAQADGGVRAQTTKQVLVRRAELDLAVDGPQVHYVGAVAAYTIRVHNAGNAPAQNVIVTAEIPPGAKFVSASEPGAAADDGSNVHWLIDSLPAGSQKTYELKCSYASAGLGRLDVAGAADNGLVASAATSTRIDAIADLALSIKDPAAPVAVGAEAEYEIHIHNRGTKEAIGVEAVGYFSRGVEPVSAEGAPYRISAGQVVFDPIASVAAGEELVLRVRAKADAAGNHIFRAEVHCKALDTRLVSEETTHFYQEGAIARQPSAAPPSAPYGPPPGTEPQPAAGRGELIDGGYPVGTRPAAPQR